MGKKTRTFDPSKYIDDDESQAELIADAFASGDARYIANALGVVARARGMTDVARKAGVERRTLYAALSDAGDPKLSTMLGVLRALGVRLSAELAPEDAAR